MGRYVVDVSDLDLKCLEWKYVDPHQHIDDIVTNRCHIALKEIAEAEIKRMLNDPNHTGPIPADHMEIVSKLELKTAKQLQEEAHEKMMAMIKDPDSAGVVGSPGAAMTPPPILR